MRRLSPNGNYKPKKYLESKLEIVTAKMEAAMLGERPSGPFKPNDESEIL